MPENCDAACVKNIINTRLVAPIAALLAEQAGDGHPLYRPAKILAAASRAACEAYAVAIEEGALVRDGVEPRWRGCDEASYLLDRVADVRAGVVRIVVSDVIEEIEGWTDAANAMTATLVRKRK